MAVVPRRGMLARYLLQIAWTHSLMLLQTRLVGLFPYGSPKTRFVYQLAHLCSSLCKALAARSGSARSTINFHHQLQVHARHEVSILGLPHRFKPNAQLQHAFIRATPTFASSTRSSHILR